MYKVSNFLTLILILFTNWAQAYLPPIDFIEDSRVRRFNKELGSYTWDFETTAIQELNTEPKKEDANVTVVELEPNKEGLADKKLTTSKFRFAKALILTLNPKKYDYFHNQFILNI